MLVLGRADAQAWMAQEALCMRARGQEATEGSRGWK